MWFKTLLTLLLFCTTIGATSVCAQQQPSRVLFLPFDVSEAGEYSYLKDSFSQMLATRLAAREGIVLVDNGQQDVNMRTLQGAAQQGQQQLFDKLGADYLVTGALFSVEKGLLMQVTFLAPEQKDPPRAFSMLAETEGEIFPAVDTLVRDIAENVFRQQPGLVGSEDVSTSPGYVSGFQVAHPEREYKKGVYSSGKVVGSVIAGADLTSFGVRRSSTLSAKMVGMVVTDVDGDGVREVVYASPGELHLLRFEQDGFRKISTFPLPTTLKIHGLSVGDLNENGRQELYISGTKAIKVASMILEWQPQGGFDVVAEEVPLYLRSMSLPGEGHVLLGQKRGVDPIDFVSPGIFRLSPPNGSGEIQVGEMLPLPRSLNLFTFAQADLDNDGTVETIAVNKNEKLMVYDQNNALIWVSEEEYGGSNNYYGPPKSQASSQDSGGNLSRDQVSEQELVFIPTRLVVKDINNDGKPEIIVGRNNRVSYRFLVNMRSYEGGLVSCLGWTGSTLEELWRTNKINGYIADYDLQVVKPGEEDAGERIRLYVGQIPESGFYSYFLPTKDKTKIYVYEMKMGAEKVIE